MFEQLRHHLEAARPRSLARMQKSLDDLIEGVRVLRRAVKEQVERDKGRELRGQLVADELTARISEMNARVGELTARIELLTLRESQLRAITTADATLEQAYDGLPAVCDEAAIGAHVREAVARAPLELDPLPYVIVTDVFPTNFYDALVRGIPPYELFADKPRNKQQLKVPLAYGPVYCRA